MRRPRRRGRIGRPTTLTPLLERQLVKAVGRVGALTLAARCCGVSYDVLLDWLARGRGTHRTGRPPTPQYVRFVRRIEKAQAQFHAARVEIIERAARACAVRALRADVQ
jgi:molybdenum-dependent DNA-binding transcriptional regulator ModE